MLVIYLSQLPFVAKFVIGFVCLVTLFIAFFALLIVKERRKYSHIPGPPVSSFFMGNAGIFRDPEAVKNGKHKIFVDLARDYGPLVKIVALHKVILFASSPEIAKELLTDSNFPKSKSAYASVRKVLGELFLGDSIVTLTDHREWKLRRHVINPSFHRTFLNQLIPEFNRVADIMVDQFNAKAESGESVSLVEVFGRATLDAICQVTFSSELEELDKIEGMSLAEELRTCGDAYTEFNYNRMMTLSWANRHKVRRYREAFRNIRRAMGNLLDRRLKQRESGEETSKDMLDIMIDGLVTHCSKEDIVSEMFTMLEAGQETTAAALSSLLLELGRHPEFEEKVREEVENVIGDKASVEAGDLDKLPWITAVLKETLRLHSPALGTNREITKDQMIGGYKVFKGTTVMVSFEAIHLLHHEDGEHFRPEKWLPENEPRSSFDFLPFSLGQRACIGRQFAWIEAKILLAKFFQRFRYQLDPSENFIFEESLTLRPASGVISKVFFA